MFLLFLDSVGLVRVGLFSMVQIRKLFFIYQQLLILTDPTSFKGPAEMQCFATLICCR